MCKVVQEEAPFPETDRAPAFMPMGAAGLATLAGLLALETGDLGPWSQPAQRAILGGKTWFGWGCFLPLFAIQAQPHSRGRKAAS